VSSAKAVLWRSPVVIPSGLEYPQEVALQRPSGPGLPMLAAISLITWLG